ncbi:MAG: DsbA family protein [Anaerolineales bacterium]|nr:DsbA family protein [Anaerolineales bacterium]
MRLQNIAPEYEGRVRLVEKAFPLEVYGGGPPDRKELELEIWLAALQEPKAVFKPFGDDWPTTTLPAFEAAWCAFQQGESIGKDFDLRIRRAFFAESRNIGKREVMLDLAREANLDMERFTRLFNSDQPRAAVLEEGKLGKEKFGVRGTPTIMLSDGAKLRHPLAYANIQHEKIISVGKLPCCGEGCYDLTRDLFEKALQHEPTKNTQGR